MLENFKPFLGRLVVEIIEEDVEGYMKEKAGLSRDSLITVVMDSKLHVPTTKGRILIKSDNSFGERFEKWYGKDIAEEGRKLQPGDIVKFVENQSYALDPEEKYHIVSDEHILGYYKESK